MLTVGVKYVLNFSNIFFGYIYIEKQVGSARLQIVDLGGFKPYTYLVTLVYQYLMKKQGVKRIGGCEDGPSEYGMVIVVVNQALVYFHPHALEVFRKPDHPNALKEERGVKTKRPLQNIFRYQHDG
jgi:hypothetical protein